MRSRERREKSRGKREDRSTSLRLDEGREKQELLASERPRRVLPGERSSQRSGLPSVLNTADERPPKKEGIWMFQNY